MIGFLFFWTFALCSFGTGIAMVVDGASAGNKDPGTVARGVFVMAGGALLSGVVLLMGRGL